MERWAANTLRVLGIVVLGHIVLGISLVLLLLSICSWGGGMEGGGNHAEGVEFLVAAVGVLAIGIWIIARLARGIMRTTAAVAAEQSALSAGGTASAPSSPSDPSAPSAASSASAPSVPFHFSPAGLRSVQVIAAAMAAQIAISAVGWFWNSLRYSHAALHLQLHFMWIFLPSFILYHVPYLVLIPRLWSNPGRRELAYSLSVPAVVLLQSLFAVGLITSAYFREPLGFLLLAVPWMLHIAILFLAYQAIQITGLHPEPRLLIRAAVITTGYFFFLHILTPLLYRVWR